MYICGHARCTTWWLPSTGTIVHHEPMPWTWCALLSLPRLVSQYWPTCFILMPDYAEVGGCKSLSIVLHICTEFYESFHSRLTRPGFIAKSHYPFISLTDEAERPFFWWPTRPETPHLSWPTSLDTLCSWSTRPNTHLRPCSEPGADEAGHPTPKFDEALACHRMATSATYILENISCYKTTTISAA